jgi:hypothetical protein
MNDLRAFRMKRLERRRAALRNELDRLWATIGRPRPPLQIVKPERTDR